MDTLDIKRILSSDRRTRYSFVDCAARDVFTRLLASVPGEGEWFYVFNTEYSGQGGEHWIAVRVDEKRVDFFDSYAQHPSVYPDVSRAMAVTGRKLSWNTSPVQGVMSTVCGDYCVLFCLLAARGWSMKSVGERLMTVEDSHERDHIVRLHLTETFGPYITAADDLVGRDGVHVPFG